MDAATSCLQQLAFDDPGESGHCARHLMGSTSAWRAWENEFRQSLSRTAGYNNRGWQRRGVRSDSIACVHRSEPFRFMRQQRVRGEARRRLMFQLHGNHSVSRSLILEHGNYIRAVSSSACAEYIGVELLGDLLLSTSIRRYETLYSEYFTAYCQASSVADAPGEGEYRELLPLLKLQVCELRAAILEYPLRRDWLGREAQMRGATGETARLQRLIFD